MQRRPQFDSLGSSPAAAKTLRDRVQAVSAELVAAAQAVLDDWQQDADGIDEEFGAGGACDAIARALADVIARSIDCEIHDGGHDGDDHAFLALESQGEQVILDIPAHVYETGGGMNWRKREGVQLTPEDLVIEPAGGLSW
jgi:hypothetical protein